jgi:hypothetical protein
MNRLFKFLVRITILSLSGFPSAFSRQNRAGGEVDREKGQLYSNEFIIGDKWAISLNYKIMQSFGKLIN